MKTYTRITTLAAISASCAILIALAPLPARSDSQTAEETPTGLVARLQQVIDQRDEPSASQLLEKLRECGESATPAIVAALEKSNDERRAVLLCALGDGDSRAAILIKAVGDRQDYPISSQRAVALLENSPVTVPLSDLELKSLQRDIEESPTMAGIASRVLAKCTKVPVNTRLEPILRRFKSEIGKEPGTDDSRPGLGSYLPRGILRLNEFLLAFSYMQEDSIPLLRAAREHGAGRSDLDKWWLLALGFSGDSSVAEELKTIVQGNSDRYVRALAVRAYARSAKQDSVPLLQSLLADPTESEYRSCAGRPVKLISMVAKDELVNLRRAKSK